jgi:hypothetical protein
LPCVCARGGWLCAAVAARGISLFHVSACNPGAIGPGVGRLTALRHLLANTVNLRGRSLSLSLSRLHTLQAVKNFSSARDALHTRPWSRVVASLNIRRRDAFCFVNRTSIKSRHCLCVEARKCEILAPHNRLVCQPQ